MKENFKLDPYGFVSDTALVITSKNRIDIQFNMSQAAAKLHIKGVGRNNLYAILREMNFIDQNNCAVDKLVDQGFFVNEKKLVQSGIINKVKVTEKGILYLEEQLKDS
ncbi:MAG: phage antirepressor KilAC domain-containing protein [Bacteroidota bacterium]